MYINRKGNVSVALLYVLLRELHFLASDINT